MAIAKKRLIPDSEKEQLRSYLQLATISALMNSRRWEQGDIAFQGGTSLHLAHGSARFSEDLDFMVRGGLSLEGLSKEVQAKLRLPADVGRDLEVSVTPAKDARNPHMFYVTQTSPKALDSLEVKVSTAGGHGAQAFVPTLTKIAAQAPRLHPFQGHPSGGAMGRFRLQEILADKIYALGARNRLKPRDVFDVWWLAQKGVTQVAPADLRTRLDIYPSGGNVPASQAEAHTAKVWMENAALRMAELRSANAPALIEADVRRWLPTVWDMRTSPVKDMITVAIEALESGMDCLEQYAAQYTGVHEDGERIALETEADGTELAGEAAGVRERLRA